MILNNKLVISTDTVTCYLILIHSSYVPNLVNSVAHGFIVYQMICCINLLVLLLFLEDIR